MNRKVILYILAGVVIISVSLIFFHKTTRANLMLVNMNKQFSVLSSFRADVQSTVDGQMTTETLLYKFPSKYKLISKNGTWSIFDGLGIFLHYDKNRGGIVKIDSNKLSDSGKIRFYSQIPPFPGIFLSRMLKQSVNFNATEMDGQKELLHFETTGAAPAKADFWIDKATGIVMKYTDSSGTEWSLSNLKLNVEIPFDEFYYFPTDEMKIMDVTETFQN